MKIQEVTVKDANGDNITAGYFKSSYETHLQIKNNQLTIGKTHILHGFVKASAAATISCLTASAPVTTSWNEVSLLITPTSKMIDIVFSPGEYWIYNWKLEVGTIPSLWSPSSLDVQENLKSIWTEYQQLSDRFRWLVVGENESSMQLTDKAYDLISKNINLTGKVTFSTFDSALQKKVNDINDAANNASTTAASAQSTAASATSAASDANNKAQGIIDNIYMPKKTTINGAVIETGTIKAGAITVDSLSAICAKLGTIESGQLKSTSINNGNGTFSVDADGNLTATSATITGTINATGGTFSGDITVDGALVGGSFRGATIAGSTITGASGSFTNGFDVHIPISNGYGNGFQTFLIQDNLAKIEFSTSENNKDRMRQNIQLTPGGVVIEAYMAPGVGETGIELDATSEISFQLTGQDTPVYGFNFYGGTVSAPNFSNTSDKRLKHCIEILPQKYINLLDILNPSQYILNYRSDGKLSFGFIAQDVNEALEALDISPDALSIIQKNEKTGMYSLSYNDFIPILWAACQQLRAEIKDLKTNHNNNQN